MLKWLAIYILNLTTKYDSDVLRHRRYQETTFNSFFKIKQLYVYYKLKNTSFL